MKKVVRKVSSTAPSAAPLPKAAPELKHGGKLKSKGPGKAAALPGKKASTAGAKQVMPSYKGGGSMKKCRGGC